MQNNKCVFVEKVLTALSQAGLEPAACARYAPLDRLSLLSQLNVDLAATGDDTIDRLRTYFVQTEPAHSQLTAIEKNAAKVVKYLNRLKGQ